MSKGGKYIPWITDWQAPPDNAEGLDLNAIQTTFRCPRCDAWAFSLWQAYGISKLKCDHCGHEQRL